MLHVLFVSLMRGLLSFVVARMGVSELFTHAHAIDASACMRGEFAGRATVIRHQRRGSRARARATPGAAPPAHEARKPMTAKNRLSTVGSRGPV